MPLLLTNRLALKAEKLDKTCFDLMRHADIVSMEYHRKTHFFGGEKMATTGISTLRKEQSLNQYQNMLKRLEVHLSKAL